MTQDLYLSEAETGHPDVHVPRQQTVKNVTAILRGEVDGIDPDELRYVSEEEADAVFAKARESKQQDQVRASAGARASAEPAQVEGQ